LPAPESMSTRRLQPTCPSPPAHVNQHAKTTTMPPRRTQTTPSPFSNT
jgi:hypothetical protein